MGGIHVHRLFAVVPGKFAAEFYLVLGIFVGFGASSMGNLATSKLVTNWFDKRRGTAAGIAASGVSLSGVVMPNVGAQLIENFDWRIGFTVFGFFTLCVVVPLVLRLVISRPEDVGMRPDGAIACPAAVQWWCRHASACAMWSESTIFG